jgi:hypothetical protein
MPTTPRTRTNTKKNVYSRKSARTAPGPKRATQIPGPKDSASEDASSRDQSFIFIKANVDVGLGNSLFIRGEGNGLSWDQGQPLACIDPGQWIWVTQTTTGKMIFKLLLNDQVWARGENRIAEPGHTLELAPEF